MSKGKELQRVGSFLYGNCFFVPKLSGLAGIENAMQMPPREKWTGLYLESQLHAWFWGNEFERVAMFRLRPAISYLIGAVGQNTRAVIPYHGRTGQYHLLQRHRPYSEVKTELLQVVLLQDTPSANGTMTSTDLKRSLQLVDHFSVLLPLSDPDEVEVH